MSNQLLLSPREVYHVYHANAAEGHKWATASGWSVCLLMLSFQARAQRSSCKQRGELGAQRIREGEQDSGLRPLAPAGQVETEEPVPYPPGSRIVVSNAGSNQEQQHGLLPKWGKRIGAALILVGAFSLMKGRSTKAKLASKKGGG
eukprot:scaffold26458_cov19-Tisochrysis_lutea.AAC.1